MIKTIGIIGAGQMGNGIAHVGALSGLDARLLDISEDALKSAVSNIDRNMDRQVKRSVVSEADRAAAMGRIQTSTDYDAFKDCDIVIEAATEDEDVKVKVFEILVPHLRSDAMIATNTSSISVTRLAASTDRPEKFIGMHFMNPVPMMNLVEIIRGLGTDDDTYQQVRALAEQMGKTVALAEDFPAFIVNRILLPMINEAIYKIGRAHV